MDKRFLAIIGIIILVFVGFLLFKNGSSSAPGSNGKPTNHIEGSAKTGVKLVEYGDYECPVCAGYFPVEQQVVAKYKDRVQFQFRNLPLTQIHQNAFAGARAAEAAALQDKFWQMHDMIYQNSHYSTQSGWVVSSNPLDDYFVGYAKQLGLNVDKFKKDFASTQVNNNINADMKAFDALAKKFKLQTATPTYFLDGKYISNAELVDSSNVPSLQAFSQVLDNAIAAKAKQSKQDTTVTNTTPKQATPRANTDTSKSTN